MTNPTLTQDTRDFFLLLANDAGNWGGEPMIGPGSNIAGNPRAHRGHLTALKKAGLVTSYTDRGDSFVKFTEAGRAFAATLGHTLSP
jgi:hypothetical protein